MVIETHLHLGVDRVFDEVRTEDEIISAMDKFGIDKAVIQGMIGTIHLDDIRESHDRIYRFCKKYPGRIYGLASINPHIRKNDYKDEIRRCIEDLGFRGIKLHAFAHACNPMSQDGLMVFQTASELAVPVMVHTGPGIPFALPAMVIPRAKEFPELPIILSHSGLVVTAGEAMIAAEEAANIYFETSWTAPHHIEHFVGRFGASRVMFASDELANIPVELAKYESLEMNPEDKELCLSGTAKKVFRIQ
ncbi:MAG: amidohydrolase family protein [Spirochaetia bacterium]